MPVASSECAHEYIVLAAFKIWSVKCLVTAEGASEENWDCVCCHAKNTPYDAPKSGSGLQNEYAVKRMGSRKRKKFGFGLFQIQNNAQKCTQNSLKHIFKKDPPPTHPHPLPMLNASLAFELIKAEPMRIHIFNANELAKSDPKSVPGKSGVAHS